MNPWWLTAGLAGTVVSALPLAKAITGLVRTHRGNRILAAPLAADQVLAFEEDGPMVLHAEGPLLSRHFAGLRYALRGVVSAAPVPMDAILVRSKVTGWSRGRLSLLTLNLPRAGDYRFTITGLDPGADHAGHCIVFTRDTRRASAARILIIVFAAITLVASLVLCVAGVLLGA